MNHNDVCRPAEIRTSGAHKECFSTWKRVALLVVIYMAFISLGLPDGVLGLAWPSMRLTLGQPIEALGLVTFCLASCSALSGFAGGHILARFGTGPVTLVSALMTGLSLLGMAHVSSFAQLIVLAFPLGLGAGAVDAGLNHFVARHYSSRHMNWLHACWGGGATLGPLIFSATLASGGNWSAGYATIAICQLMLAAILLASLRLWSQAPESVLGADHPLTVAARRLAPGWAQVLAPALFALYVAVEMGVGLWAGSILIESRHFAAETAGMAVTCYYGAIMGGRMLVGLVSDRLGNRPLVYFGLVTAGVGVALFMVAGFAGLNVTGLFLIGLGCAPVYPGLMHETPRRFDPATAQRVIGWQVGAAYVGAMVIPGAFGVLAAHWGLEAIFPIIGGVIAILLAAIALLDRVTG